MRPLIVLLTLLSTTALADDTTSASEAARTEYHTNLTELLTSSQVEEEASVGKCAEAKDAYRLAEGELARINTELEANGSEILGDVRANYMSTLEGLKTQEEAKLEQAKSEALEAGANLSEVRTKIEAIEAEISRIDEEIRLEQARTETYTSRSSRSSGLGYGGTADALGGMTRSSHTTPPKPPPLPGEFKGCFPDEVAPGS